MGAMAKWLPTQSVSGAPNGAGWLRGPQGLALSTSLGTELDLQQSLLLQGLLARFPTSGNVDANGVFGLAPSDALDQIGGDRLLPRGPAESDATYAARLLGAWDIWTYAGSHYGVLRALKTAGYAAMLIVQDKGRYGVLVGSAGTVADLSLGTLMTCANRPGDAPGWTFDNRIDFYSRFAIVFTADATNLQTASGQKTLVNIVDAWKPAKAQFVGAGVILAGVTLGWPTGRTLGTESVLGGNSIRTIPGDGSAPFVTGP